jgi:hypothetical protein
MRRSGIRFGYQVFGEEWVLCDFLHKHPSIRPISITSNIKGYVLFYEVLDDETLTKEMARASAVCYS